MNRGLHMLLPGALVLATFSCGGSSAPGLFSGVDGRGGAGSAGFPASAGSTSAAGQSSVAGNLGTAGESSGGSGVAGSPSSSAGTPGSGGVAAGGAGFGGAGTGGSGASSGTAGSASSAGSSGATTCSSLFSLASMQLQAATACNLAQNSDQCTGKEKTTCGCQVAIEKDGSPEAQAYEDTLKQIADNHCTQACPAIACLNVSKGVCKPNTQGNSGTMGTCSSASGLPIQNGF